MSLYLMIYHWRNVFISTISYICFLINTTILLTFIYGFILLSKGIPDPIYIEDLFIFSYYRYVIFFGITLLVIIVYLLIKCYPFILPYISTVTYPHLKEQVRLILFTWDEGPLGWLNSKFIHIIQVLQNISQILILKITLISWHEN